MIKTYFIFCVGSLIYEEEHLEENLWGGSNTGLKIREEVNNLMLMSNGMILSEVTCLVNGQLNL